MLEVQKSASWLGKRISRAAPWPRAPKIAWRAFGSSRSPAHWGNIPAWGLTIGSLSSNRGTSKGPDAGSGIITSWSSLT
jgi:hypothetical protein